MGQRKQCRSWSDAANAASDHDLHCLPLIRSTIKIFCSKFRTSMVRSSGVRICRVNKRNVMLWLSSVCFYQTWNVCNKRKQLCSTSIQTLGTTCLLLLKYLTTIFIHTITCTGIYHDLFITLLLGYIKTFCNTIAGILSLNKCVVSKQKCIDYIEKWPLKVIFFLYHVYVLI